jgi:hypothetical protein
MEKRIYVVVAETIQTDEGLIIQPAGRQIAQACHAVTSLRYVTTLIAGIQERPCPLDKTLKNAFMTMTTIILQARNTAEMNHVYRLLRKKRLNPVLFADTNPEYGPGEWPTSFAVFATQKQTEGILDYLPLWGN